MKSQSLKKDVQCGSRRSLVTPHVAGDLTVAQTSSCTYATMQDEAPECARGVIALLVPQTLIHPSYQTHLALSEYAVSLTRALSLAHTRLTSPIKPHGRRCSNSQHDQVYFQTFTASVTALTGRTVYLRDVPPPAIFPARLRPTRGIEYHETLLPFHYHDSIQPLFVTGVLLPP